MLCLTSLCFGIVFRVTLSNEVSVTGKILLRRLEGIVKAFSDRMMLGFFVWETIQAASSAALVHSLQIYVYWH